MQKISPVEFTDRLTLLCLNGGGRGFPHKHRDRHILFKSVTLTLESDRIYTETEVNERLIQWLNCVGQAIELDHVSLRRDLIDAGYLKRDLAGRGYRIDPEQVSRFFELEVDAIDPVAVLEESARKTEERKQQYLEKTMRG